VNYNNLGSWQAASSKDGNSISMLPPYVSSTDLHLTSANGPTLFESSGLATSLTGINIDIDGQNRPGPTALNGGGTSADIGADEFDGIPVSCKPPTNLSANTPTATAFTLTWNAPSVTPALGYELY